MPRGKRTVFAGFCKGSTENPDCNTRVLTIRLHKQKGNKSWKDTKLNKYCPACMQRTDVKLSEERHSK